MPSFEAIPISLDGRLARAAAARRDLPPRAPGRRAVESTHHNASSAIFPNRRLDPSSGRRRSEGGAKFPDVMANPLPVQARQRRQRRASAAQAKKSLYSQIACFHDVRMAAARVAPGRPSIAKWPSMMSCFDTLEAPVIHQDPLELRHWRLGRLNAKNHYDLPHDDICSARVPARGLPEREDPR